MSEYRDVFKQLIESRQDELISNLQTVIRFPSVSELSDGEFPFGKMYISV